MVRKIFRKLKPVEEVLEILFSNLPKTPFYEVIKLDDALGRIIAKDITSEVDVPGFDRASMDGYAVIAEDIFGADELSPVNLKNIGKIEASEISDLSIKNGECVEISTGAPVPKGANAVVMVEYTDSEEDTVKIYKPVVSGENIQFTGSDIMKGEIIIRKNQLITSREIGVLSASGICEVPVYYSPKVGIISTGNELTPVGAKLEYGKIYDINSHTITAAVKESGGTPEFIGIIGDKREKLIRILKEAVSKYDIILTSGSTSAGIGDMMFTLLDELGEPGVLVHGVAIKPGKPTIVAKVNNTLIIGLPGYPTSALSIFNLFVKPVLTKLSKKTILEPERVKANLAFKLIRKTTRRELLPVNLVKINEAFAAYPILKGSGAITTLVEADGYIEISEKTRILEEGLEVEVKLFPDVTPANLMIIGSHCIGVDLLLNFLTDKYDDIKPKVINVGSLGGVNAIVRGEADIAGVHVINEQTGKYNLHLINEYNLKDKAVIIRGYTRIQGLILPKGNPKGIKSIDDIVNKRLYVINRTKGSGTRILFDSFLKKILKDEDAFNEFINRLPGYNIEAKTHSAVAVAVKQGKAEVGIGIKPAADNYDLDFIPLIRENYDFMVLKKRLEKPEVKRFFEVLKSSKFKTLLEKTIDGYKITEETGKILIS
ncbi:MAG: molybdopterin biosynthesis protein [Candidatus Odinarchaeia archaeon]